MVLSKILSYVLDGNLGLVLTRSKVVAYPWRTVLTKIRSPIVAKRRADKEVYIELSYFHPSHMQISDITDKDWWDKSFTIEEDKKC